MTKQEFMSQLAATIANIQDHERYKILDYYSELIDDRVENGEAEPEVIASFGSINELAQKIKDDYPDKKMSSASKGVIITALAFGSPIWIGLGIAAISILFSLAVAALSILFSFFVTAFALALSAIVGFFMSLAMLGGNPQLAFFQIGVCLFSAGLSIFIFHLSMLLFKLMTKGTKIGMQTIKNAFAKRRISNETLA